MVPLSDHIRKIHLVVNSLLTSQSDVDVSFGLVGICGETFGRLHLRPLQHCLHHQFSLGHQDLSTVVHFNRPGERFSSALVPSGREFNESAVFGSICTRSNTLHQYQSDQLGCSYRWPSGLGVMIQGGESINQLS